MTSNLIKIISEKSGLHCSLVEYLKRNNARCKGLFVTNIRIHSLKQVNDECILSVEVYTGGCVSSRFEFFNISI